MKIEKTKIYQLYCKEKRTMKEIGNMFGISRKHVKKILMAYDIDVRKTRAKVDAPSKEELLNLYTKQMLTIKQICNIYGVGKKAVNAWFKKYDITKISNAERKYYHIRRVPLTGRQKELVIGTLLGDGSLATSGKFKRLTMGHSVNQLDYLLWKKEIFKNLINNIYRQIQSQRNSTVIHCASVGHQDFNFFYKLFYNNNKKIIRHELVNYVTPFSMAIWYMDDGSSKPYCMKISTEGFTRKENEILQHIIYVNFNIRCKVCEYNRRGKKYNYLSFNKKNSIKLCNLIEPYIIDSMKYKIPFPNDCTPSTNNGNDTV